MPQHTDHKYKLTTESPAAPPEHQDDMLRYLANTLHPLRISRQGANFRTAEPWPVNIPPEFRAAGPELDT